MGTRAKDRLDVITNILTIVVAVLLIGLFVHRYLLPSESAALAKSPTIGKVISVDNFETSKASKNVFIVMMKGCRFCEESMDFYTRLVQENQGRNVKIVAVFPRGSQDIETYLKTYGVTGIDVRYSELSKVEVDATPTIIITDENGKITKSWVGKLSSEKETEVISFLNL